MTKLKPRFGGAFFLGLFPGLGRRSGCPDGSHLPSRAAGLRPSAVRRSAGIQRSGVGRPQKSGSPCTCDDRCRSRTWRAPLRSRCRAAVDCRRHIRPWSLGRPRCSMEAPLGGEGLPTSAAVPRGSQRKGPASGAGLQGGRSETLEGSCLTFTPNTTVGAFGSLVLRTYIGLSKKQQLTLVL